MTVPEANKKNIDKAFGGGPGFVRAEPTGRDGDDTGPCRARGRDEARPSRGRGGGRCRVLQNLRKRAKSHLDFRAGRRDSVADFCRNTQNQEAA